MGVTVPAQVAQAPPASIAAVQLVTRGTDVVAMVALTGPLERVLAETSATDADPADGTVALNVAAAGQTTLTPASAGGVTARVVARGAHSLLRLRAAPGRFFAVSYDLATQPARLVVHLWAAVPAGKASYGPAGCLAVDQARATPGRVQVTGRERHIFEHSFVVQLRDGDGHVLAARPVVARGGRFTVTLRPTPAVPGPGFVEAVAESAKDGSLACLARQPVTLR